MTDEVLAATEEMDEATAKVAEETPQVETSESSEGESATPTEDVSADSKGEEVKAEEEKPKQKPKNKGYQNRINKLTKELRSAQRYIAEREAPQANEPLTKPEQNGFENYEDYLDARQDYRSQQHNIEANRQQAHEVQAAQAEDYEQAFTTARETLTESGIEKFADFEEVTQNSELEISPNMAEALLTSEHGDLIWYHLGKNPSESEKISQMQPAQQLMALGRLETKLTSAKQPSKAPAPIKPTSNRGGSGRSGLSDEMSQAEWMAERNRQVHG